MGWKHYQIKDHAPHPSGHFKWKYEAYYWQVNLMCHLFKNYTYGEMFDDSVSHAMQVLHGRVGWIQDEDRGSDEMELLKSTKQALKNILSALASLFSEFYPKTKMKDLYTSPAGTFEPAVVTLFEALDYLVGLDTGSQVRFGKKRFHKPCEVCLPFLPILKGTSMPVSEAHMKKVIADLGPYELRDLYLAPAANASLVSAIWFARSVHVLSSPSKKRKEAKIIEFNNDLVCSNGSCVTQDDCFCVSGTEGCSAMSSGGKVRLKKRAAQKKVR